MPATIRVEIALLRVFKKEKNMSISGWVRFGGKKRKRKGKESELERERQKEIENIERQKDAILRHGFLI